MAVGDLCSDGSAGADDGLALEVSAAGPLGDGVLIVVRGELDMFSTPRLLGCLLARIMQRPAAVVIDLAAVSFLASSGLNALIEARARGVDRGVALRLVTGGNRVVERALTISGLDRLFVLDRSGPGGAPAPGGPG